jgi:squalene-associated FAD-dependent desaturase
MMRVGVIGGGLAGITAALDCADAGASVVLFEARPRLGGATFSTKRNGYWLDNGQHVALRCCSEYRRLLSRLGTDRLLHLQPRLAIDVLDPDGRTARFGRSDLPAPFHLLKALATFGHLTPRERFAAARAIQALRTVDPDDPDADATTFAQWLGDHGQSPRTVDRLWNLIVLPTLNLRAEEASLAAAAFVFRTGFLEASDACDLGVPSVPLGQLHGEAAAAELARSGVEVQLRTKIDRIVPGEAGLELEIRGARTAFDRVISAVPHEATPGLLPNGVYPAAGVRLLGASPIVNVHLHYDRRVLHTPVAAVVSSPLQWIFDRTDAAGVETGQLLAISLSAAVAEMKEPSAQIVARSTEALVRMLPRARSATLLDSTVTRSPRATFRAAPGAGGLRPPAQTDVPGLSLAGAWTDTGWPATMEGAVRSGHAAAREALMRSSTSARARREVAA